MYAERTHERGVELRERVLRHTAERASARSQADVERPAVRWVPRALDKSCPFAFRHEARHGLLGKPRGRRELLGAQVVAREERHEHRAVGRADLREPTGGEALDQLLVEVLRGL